VSLRLLPEDDNRVRSLAQDYRDMQPMFFTKPPPFSVIREELKQLELALNASGT
jgi:hypothetical protein